MTSAIVERMRIVRERKKKPRQPVFAFFTTWKYRTKTVSQAPLPVSVRTVLVPRWNFPLLRLVRASSQSSAVKLTSNTKRDHQANGLRPQHRLSYLPKIELGTKAS